MGQYYMTYVGYKDGTYKVFDRSVDGEFTSAKLMEHSWWDDPFVNSICHLIHHAPKKIAWVGDYACESSMYHIVWGDDTFPETIEEAQVLLDNKCLVNHTSKTYLDCSKYYRNSVESNGWCIHPLPILTVIGNGRGIGDYRSSVGKEYVGTWAEQLISVENETPVRYKELEIIFRE